MLSLVGSSAFRKPRALQNMHAGSQSCKTGIEGFTITLSLSNASLTGFNGCVTGVDGVVEGGGGLSAIVYQTVTVR